MSVVRIAASTPRIAEGERLWTPPPDAVGGAAVERFRHWVNARHGLDLCDYDALWRWSVDEVETFWAAVWAYFDVHATQPYERVLAARTMPGAVWFEGARVNYAEHLLRRESRHPDAPALLHASELRDGGELSWGELGRQVRTLATRLRELGIGPGDCVGAYMPNIPETAVAMLATTAIGATWAAASPEFGSRAVIERFAQIAPKLLFVVDGYRFDGVDFERGEQVAEIVAGLGGVEHVICLPYLVPQRAPQQPGAMAWADLLATAEPAQFEYEYVAHDHPLWVLFSSGTTGLPKAVIHSHVGILVEHCKLTAFHVGLTPESRPFYFSTSGWMMWNVLLASLLQGATPVLYDGCPIGPDPEVLWKLVERMRVTHFGTSPSFAQIMQKAGLRPCERYDLSALHMILLAGSPAMPETFAWFYEDVKPDLWVTSQSGGTEIASAFVGAVPSLPVYAGEIQTRLLGMDVDVWNEQGEPVVDQTGELVVRKPFPSMPLRFWNDAGNARYHDTYFQTWPGVWRHGDSTKINDRGGVYVYGRSDSTLNRYGVCIGTAEIYRSVERIDDVIDSIIVCCELAGGRFFMPMFVKLRAGLELDEAMRARIRGQLRADCSPRHVPDQLYRVDKIPYTLTGKKMEVPVRKLLSGWPLEKAASRDAMLDPTAIDWFVRFRADNHAMLTG
ncbi:acetoacetate--CoA ligase [Solimonas marina]|uniref:Acetoacetate--CoA ligase n=1 Tax=Solimonas marina TaxID=2714601 RepID=A0A969W986_9GAMM|nr:acetoacetate--CoA ligase [Solimonas marina]NKF21865.1 acetoacetate--CoA ligase [Solimonas marina]